MVLLGLEEWKQEEVQQFQIQNEQKMVLIQLHLVKALEPPIQYLVHFKIWQQ